MASKVVLVTGASSGIGAATAHHLAASGWTVIGVSRSGTIGNPDGTRAGAASGGPAATVTPATLDITDAAAVDRLIARSVGDHGRLDAVVNAAGIAVAGPLEDTPPELAARQIEVNLVGAALVSRAALPHLRRAAPAHLVYVSSLAGEVPLPFQAVYCAAKAGLEGLCRALRFELEPHAVRVTVVQPGSVRTGLTASREVAGPSGAYSQAASNALAQNDQDELAGLAPLEVARAINAILRGADRREVVPVAHFHERIALPARRWLPASLVRRGIARHYRL
jgi:NAD(P)-dependent dehydrogenase (short-subunit alcohol dehydrogenase family)